ncbi:Uncharacterized conserved protein, DUF983 family [Faunimonas pinastri]|uniref:Uncharacterized conserved protein, DUF983 family n=1 Tax=Faunimonas pinastri TaxID=1855383 RepID=A0A1H8ZN69_9HYPH|nr:DUF983 domain-containing protein [Faunimonas pinastri]SEP65880.1 Uncharacterized conserved protein, DUF983 family [Faunimonas pinastri]
MPDKPTYFPPLNPVSTGLRGRCPRCGYGHMFKGFLTFRERCEVCGLDYSFANTADGPAFFVMTLVSFIVVAAAMIVELAYSPPIWVHVVLWVPLIFILCCGGLRPFKGVLMAVQYTNKAEEGSIDRSGDPL